MQSHPVDKAEPNTAQQVDGSEAANSAQGGVGSMTLPIPAHLPVIPQRQK